MEQPHTQLLLLQEQRRTPAERSRHSGEDLHDGGQSDGAHLTAQQQVGRPGGKEGGRRGKKESKDVRTEDGKVI